MDPQSNLLVPLPILLEIILLGDKLVHLRFRATCKLFKKFLEDNVMECMFTTAELASENDDTWPSGGAYDKKRGCVYLSRTYGDSIYKLDLASREFTTAVKSNTKCTISNFVIDGEKDLLYFARNDGAIFELSLKGLVISQISSKYAIILPHKRSLTLDRSKGIIYFVDEFRAAVGKFHIEDRDEGFLFGSKQFDTNAPEVEKYFPFTTSVITFNNRKRVLYVAEPKVNGWVCYLSPLILRI